MNLEPTANCWGNWEHAGGPGLPPGRNYWTRRGVSALNVNIPSVMSGPEQS